MFRDNSPFYSTRLIRKYLFILIGIAAIMRYTNGIGFAAVIPLAFAAFARNRANDLFFYMFATIAMVVANPVVVHKGGVFFMEQRAMMILLGLVMAVKVASQRRIPYLSPFMFLMVYILFMIVPSVVGWCPIVSYAKLFLFGAVYLAYYGAAKTAANHPRDYVRPFRSIVLSICILFLIGSVLVLPFPGISQLYDEMYLGGGRSLFRGLTAHCNCLGPMISGMATLLYADMLFGLRRYDKLYLVLLACAPVLIWRTSSRTAMATLVCGLAFTTFFFTRARNVSGRWKGRITSLALLGAIGLCLFVVASPSMREKAAEFIIKKGDSSAEMSVENIVSSRMGLMTSGLANFKKKPMIGNGFQVAPQMMELSRKMEWYHLLSAPVEKGVWTTAILEEGGVIGMSLFLIFLAVVMSALLRYKAYVAASTFFVFVVSNFGEFSFFSMSFLGGFMWTLVFAAVVMDTTRMRQERVRRQMAAMPPPMPFVPRWQPFL